MNRPTSYRFEVEGVSRELRVVEVAPGVHIGILLLATDPELTEAVGKAIARLVPSETEVLVMPDGKAQALLHVVARETGLPSVLLRKERKGYLSEPVLSVRASSITTATAHSFHLDGDDAGKIAARRAVILDDVVSSGATVTAARELIEQAGGVVSAILAVGTEGEARSNVIALHHFPIFRTTWE